MKNSLLILTAAFALALASGCANGPLRNWFNGAPCNTCNPHAGQPMGDAAGFGFAETPVGSGCSTCAAGSGMVGTATAPPASIPASGFQSAPSFSADSGGADIYGNVGGSGRLETPPIGPYN